MKRKAELCVISVIKLCTLHPDIVKMCSSSIINSFLLLFFQSTFSLINTGKRAVYFRNRNWKLVHRKKVKKHQMWGLEKCSKFLTKHGRNFILWWISTFKGSLRIICNFLSYYNLDYNTILFNFYKSINSLCSSALSKLLYF